jgi:ribosome-binding factor A
MINEIKQNRINEAIKDAAAEFLERESSGVSLITVTGTKISDKGKRITVLFTVLPEEKEGPAVEFANRQKNDFALFLKSRAKIGRLPSIDFEIDLGEKHRQKIDKLSSEIKSNG